MPDLEFDVAVVGGGIGGYSTAIRLSQLGKKVLLVEENELGGECLNYACIPAKASMHFASLYYKVSGGEKYGISALNLTYDQKRFLDWRDQQVKRLRSGIETLCRRSGIKVLRGKAKFISRKAVKVGNKGPLSVKADKIVIATGSLPKSISQASFDGGKIIDSREALSLKHVPETMVIVGGGVAGVEIGQIYASLGSKVTVIEIMDQILPGFSRSSAGVVRRSLEKMGVEVNLDSRVRKVKYLDEGVEVTFETRSEKRKVYGDYLLITVGRKPNTEGLNLQSIGVEMDDKGFIKVDENLESSVKGVYAVGDVTGHPMLAHKAMAQGIMAAESIAGVESKVSKIIPSVVYSKPEVAVVGIDETRARARGVETLVGMFPFMASGRALTMDEAEGYVKVIANKKTHRIIGMEIVGPEASELISIGVMAINYGARLEDVASLTMPHPTLSEAVVEAAKAALGESIHVIGRRRESC